VQEAGMSNQPIIDDLNRIKKAAVQRAPRWDLLDTALKDAEQAAHAQLKTISKQMGGSYNLDWPLGLKNLSQYAFYGTRINGISSSAFLGKLEGPIIHGFLWFQAIFNSTHERGQTLYKVADSQIPMVPADSFGEMISPARMVAKLAAEFDRLTKVIAAEKEDLPKVHADKAVSAMLLAPILFPPVNIPNAKTIEIQLEWFDWQMHMPDIAENIYADYLKSKVYENPPKTNLDVLFKRLGDLVMAAYAAQVPLTGYLAMSDLQALRKGLEKRTITGKDFRGGELFVDLTVAVNFPPKVKNYLNAHGFEAQQKVYMADQRMTFAEAGL
jgi:hypothetical protein